MKLRRGGAEEEEVTDRKTTSLHTSICITYSSKLLG